MSAEQYGYYGGGVAPPVSASIPPSASVYGEQRPTFSEDGTGAPYTTMLNLVGTSAINSDISYDTSSKDPHMIRARVFIGNIARAIITRDDIIELFRPFGKILAVNYFAQQGFGFVQFNEATHADQSCLQLNGRTWKGCALDVHLAMLGSLKKPSAGGGGASQPVVPPVVHPVAPAASVENAHSQKRPYEEEEYEIFKQNKKNKHFANGDKTTNDNLAPNEMCDTMVCGHCRFVTSDFEEFKDHRIAGCGKYKDPEEPRHRLKCATCHQRFLGAWGLLEHLTEFHRMLLYNEERLSREELDRLRGNGSTPSSQTSEVASTSAAPRAGPPSAPPSQSANSSPSQHLSATATPQY
ncbi:unnamed protein product [Caenorhabditis sp. 36 PRJEB53466]|nr:unnamed protein product [Caenorhabditis sp. 36 PRJEB53466]